MKIISKIKINTVVILSFMAFTISAENELSFNDMINQSKPAPNPRGKTYTREESMSESQRQEVGYDFDTQTTFTKPFESKNHLLQADKGFKGTAVTGESKDDIDHPNLYFSRGGATPPTQALITTTYPWGTIYKLVMRFNVNGTDFFYNCSAWAAGDFHLVTAGHCIYNFDPNDDGDESDQKWADEVWVFGGQTDRVVPNDCGNKYCADWPYGWARSRQIRSYSGWTVDQNLDHDFAVITMDRNVGQRTGWMGRSSDVEADDSLNFSGYPTESAYVPSGVNVQYQGFDSGNVVAATDYRVQMDAFIYGGHSGGPSWKFEDGNRYVVGIHSTSNRTGTAYDTLLTTGKRDDINSWIATDEVDRPPVPRGDLSESLFDGNPHKSISKTAVGRDEDLTVNFQIMNAGFADITNTINVDFYASTNETISTADRLIGSSTISTDIGDWSLLNVARNVTVPDNMPAGDYTVGWIMSVSGEHQNDQDCIGTPCSNIVAITNQVMSVQACTSDVYEDDNANTTGNNLFDNSSQTHSICTIGDTDWYRLFVPSGSHEVTLETNGAIGDTVIELYNSSVNSIEVDDDDGAGLFSKIDRVCSEDALSSGTYYVKVEEFGNNGTIDNYTIDLNMFPCNDIIFRHGFED